MFGRTWGQVKHFWVKYPFKFMLLQGFSLCKFSVPFICPTIHNSLKLKVRFHTNIAYFSILSCGLWCCHGTWSSLGEGLLTIAVSHWNRENVDHWLQGMKAVQSSERSDSNRGRGALDGGRSNATRTETFSSPPYVIYFLHSSSPPHASASWEQQAPWVSHKPPESCTRPAHPWAGGISCSLFDFTWKQT